MTTNILLVRHGQTAANVEALYSGWSEVDLSDVGHMQARRLSDKLASVPMRAI
jgi:broad specificity phosphatase PhoE